MARQEIQRCLYNYEWLHMSLGVIGNARFFIGSFLMLFAALAGGLTRQWEHTHGPPEGHG